MRLAKGIYFDRVGKMVYLRDVKTFRDYLFNEIVFDILEMVRTGEYYSEEKISLELSEMYDCEPEVICEDIRAMISELISYGVIEDDGNAAEDMLVRDSVAESCIREKRLFSAAFELTYRCNERCRHCYIDETSVDTEKRELTLDEYKSIIDELHGIGCMELLLTGGEVLLRDDFTEVAGYASSKGMLVDIYTNGTLLTYDLLEKIRGIYPNSMSFSLYGGDAETHDSVTGVSGSFEKTLRAAMMTKCAGIDTYVKIVVMKQNIKSLEKLIGIGKLLDIPVSASFAILDSHSGKSQEGYRISDVGEYRRAMEITGRYQPDNGEAYEHFHDPNGRVCSAGLCSLSINPYGEVYPCITLRTSLGNVRKNSIESIWNGSELLERLRSLKYSDICSKCTSCKYINHCEMCLGRTGLKQDNVPSETCMIAEALYNLKTISNN